MITQAVGTLSLRPDHSDVGKVVSDNGELGAATGSENLLASHMCPGQFATCGRFIFLH